MFFIAGGEFRCLPDSWHFLLCKKEGNGNARGPVFSSRLHCLPPSLCLFTHVCLPPVFFCFVSCRDFAIVFLGPPTPVTPKFSFLQTADLAWETGGETSEIRRNTRSKIPPLIEQKILVCPSLHTQREFFLLPSSSLPLLILLKWDEIQHLPSPANKKRRGGRGREA